MFEDVDTSAFLTRVKRPAFERMLTALRSGDLVGIVVWKLDRLSRQQRDLVRVMEACEPHKAFIASVMEPIDTRETYGQFVAELLVAQARMESANTSARIRRKVHEIALQGDPPVPGKRGFGYSRDHNQVIPEEAALIREARDRLLAGESLRALCYDWQRRGVETTLGNPFQPSVLKRMLTSPIISGQREKEGQFYPGKWPAILPPDEWAHLRAILTDPARRLVQNTARKYELSGYLRCGVCGLKLVARPKMNGVRKYVCAPQPGRPPCGKIASVAEPVEELIREMLFAAVDDASLTAKLATKGIQDDGLSEAIARDEAALEALANDHYVERLISRQEFLPARGTLARRLEANREKLARRDGNGVVSSFLGHGGALREAWERGSLDWRRAVVGALVDHIDIMPAVRKGRNVFDYGRVRPIWRH